MFEPSLYRKCKTFRNEANRDLPKANRTGAQCSTFITKGRPGFALNDPMEKVESNFILSMVGDAGSKVVFDKALAVLPDVNKRVTLEKARDELKKIQRTDLHKFVNAATQSNVKTIYDMIVHMIEGKNPEFGASPIPFVQAAKARMAFFCYMHPLAPGGSPKKGGQGGGGLGRHCARGLAVGRELGADQRPRAV